MDIENLDPNILDVWDKDEKIAMHFNDLILRVRIQALGAIAAIITVGGVLLKTTSPTNIPPWGIISSTFATLLAFWIAIWILDFKYYNRLLLGAVDSLLKLEDQINKKEIITFDMSHKIEDSVLGKPATHLEKGILTGPTIFYLIVCIVLSLGFLYSTWKFICY